MASDIGKGTRLLCVVGADGGTYIKAGTIYTCEMVIPNRGYPTECGYHGPEAQCDGVRLQECINDYGLWEAHCLQCFRPIGGDLHESIRIETILKDVKAPPVRERIKETVDG